MTSSFSLNTFVVLFLLGQNRSISYSKQVNKFLMSDTRARSWLLIMQTKNMMIWESPNYHESRHNRNVEQILVCIDMIDVFVKAVQRLQTITARYLVRKFEENEPSTKLLIPFSDIYLRSAAAGLSSSNIKVSTYMRIKTTNL